MAADGLLLGIGVLAGVMIGAWAMPLVALTVMSIELVQARVRWRPVIIVVVGIAIGVVRGALAPEAVMMADLPQSRGAEGVVSSVPIASGDVERAIVTVDRIATGDSHWIERAGRVLVYLPASPAGPVNIGDHVYLVWSATPNEHLSPGYADYLRSLGVSGSARAWHVEITERGSGWARYLTDARRAISRVLQEAIPGDAGALAAGIVTGDDSGLSEEARLWFRQTGTTHLTAVSGQNVALLIGFLAIGLPPQRRSIRWLSHGTMLTVVWLYVGMVGLEAPAVRAAAIATLMMLGSWVGRRPDPVTILAVTLGAMALVDPGLTRQVGFLLSATASWALCGSVRLFKDSLMRSRVLDMASSVMAANIATLPILLLTFGEWSPVSLLANLLLGPVMIVAFPASYLFLFLALALPGIAPGLAWLPAIPLDLSLVIVHRLSTITPMFHLPVTSPAMALLVSLPCLGVLVLLSRDGERWLLRMYAAWRGPDHRVRHLVAGLAAGAVTAVAGIVVIWG